jgi:uncharacterized membrane protein
MSDFKVVRIKRSSTAGSVPTASQLLTGELAVNLADAKLYTKNEAGDVVLLNPAPSTAIGTANWTIEQVGTSLIFKHNGVNKLRLETTGRLTATGDVGGFGSL